MAQSLTKIYVHLTFGTKLRLPLIQRYIRPRLKGYITGIMKNIGCSVLKINCVNDHVHILFRMPKQMNIAEIVEQVKKQSSKWIKTTGAVSNIFHWQKGYCAFSVGYSQLFFVKRYIDNQDTHHKDKTYQDEILELIKKNNITDFNKEFFWD